VTCTPIGDSPYACNGYRLPTEAEWEYAARAGDPRATYNGDLDVKTCFAPDWPSSVLDPIAWFDANSSYSDGGRRTHEVAGKRPNAWGLYDMLGNVWEWCHDWYGDYPTTPGAVENPVGPGEGPYRVLRGVSFNYDNGYIRAAIRDPGYRTSGDGSYIVRSYVVGFRPVRSLP
jgi:formylglycine-generating enzyme required for sulfatase activity